MRTIALRFLIAFALAFLGPWPGPHVGLYVPIGATLLHGDLADASIAYFLIVAVAIAVYTLVLFGVISVMALLFRRK